MKKTKKNINKKICCNCDSLFEENDIGNLGCYFHPLEITEYKQVNIEYKFKKRHYECCGLTDNPDDKIHFEREKPYGCQRIDHHTEEEKDEIKKNPYKVIFLEELENYKYATKENSYFFYTLEEMNKNNPFKIEFPIEHYGISIDLSQIQEDLKKKINERLVLEIENLKERVGIQTKNHEVITDKQKLIIFDQLLHDKNRPKEDRQKLLEILKIQNKIRRGIFIPFVIIMRLSITSSRLKKVRSSVYDWCPFGYEK